MALTREQLDQSGCGAPNCGHDHSVLHLVARCHPKAGLAVAYEKRTGAVTVKCERCKAVVVEIAVAAR